MGIGYALVFSGLAISAVGMILNVSGSAKHAPTPPTFADPSTSILTAIDDVLLVITEDGKVIINWPRVEVVAVNEKEKGTQLWGVARALVAARDGTWREAYPPPPPFPHTEEPK